MYKNSSYSVIISNPTNTIHCFSFGFYTKKYSSFAVSVSNTECCEVNYSLFVSSSKGFCAFSLFAYSGLWLLI